MKKISCTWEQIDEGIELLAFFLKSLDLQYITGIPRGGLIPAVMLSHKLDVKYKCLEEILTSTTLMYGVSDILVLDDIFDSGKTLSYYSSLGFLTAALHKKVLVGDDLEYEGLNFYVYPLLEKEYIVYPWERYDAPAIPNYLINE